MPQTLPPAAESRRPYKVFVSSTFLDNKKRRKLVQDTISMAGMAWHGMEIFTASTRPTDEECVRLVRFNSDALRPQKSQNIFHSLRRGLSASWLFEAYQYAVKQIA